MELIQRVGTRFHRRRRLAPRPTLARQVNLVTFRPAQGRANQMQPDLPVKARGLPTPLAPLRWVSCDTSGLNSLYNRHAPERSDTIMSINNRSAATYGNFCFHVGLHKTGTTYLQDVVFPNWPGVKYLRFRNLEYFLALSNTQKYLISCESLSGATFASLDERCRGLTRLAGMFPGARIVIAFRPHGDFIASLYSQYLRYGGQATFDGFFSLSSPNIVWHREDLCYRKLIETIEDSFQERPFVFQLSELRDDEERLLADLARFVGTPPLQKLRKATPKNASLGAWQGRLLRRINELASTPYSRDGGNRPYRKLHRFGMDPPTICHRLLGRFPAQPLVSGETRQKITHAYREDWDFVTGYIASLPFRQSATVGATRADHR